MTNKKTFIALLITGLLGLTVISGAYAYRGDPSVEGPYHTDERETAMEEAFANNDYNAWAELMEGRGRVSQVINADNFAKFAEAHKLAEEGNLEAAQEIRTELGLGLNNGENKGMGRGNRSGARDGSGNRGNSGNCIYNK